MAEQGSYPMNGRTLGPTDTATGVVSGQTADIPLSLIASFALGSGGTSGPTGSRPNPATFIGQLYFDTTLGQPVFASQLSPSLWVNAAGVTV